MKEKFIIVEAGSTMTKGFLYENGKITELPSEFIEFKKHYTSENKILSDDKEKLFNYINGLKEITSQIYIYGTSIFRIMSDEERLSFSKKLENKTGANFKVVSADEERKYTVNGILANINYDDNIAIVVSGGGSTEIAIVNNNKIIEELNLSIGGVDITNMYPDLADEFATTNIEEVVEYISLKLTGLKNKAQLLVTGGGCH